MIEQQRHLLASWRKILALCLNLQHDLGADLAPAQAAVGIVEARAEIARLKGMLRGQGEQVADDPDELAIGDSGEALHQLRLLEIHRRRLALLLGQQSQFTARDLPPHVAAGIGEARREIARIKRRLREWNAPVGDLSDD
jgi:hypothetical protein